MAGTTSASDSARTCPNCGSAAPERYCPGCGQRQVERLVSTRRMIGELLEDSFSLEARLPRTAVGLLFRPGFLTREYTAGRIVRYVQPVRLYIVASLAFFLVLSLVADFDRLWDAVRVRVEDARDQDYVLIRLGITEADVPAPLKPAMRAWERQEAELNGLERREGLRVIYDATLAAIPPVLFLLVPVFALVLKGLYRRRLFVEHALFVLHFHALGFLLAALALVVRAPAVLLILFAWLAIWLFLGLRRVYGEREPSTRTLFKYLVLGASYLIAFAITVVVVMIAAVMSV